MKLFILTSLTMVAFAANSILCRLALIDAGNQPVSFTILRIFSGAFVLLIFLKGPKREFIVPKTILSLVAPIMLFSYALFFSLSYVSMEAGMGALILFASVQLTMMGISIIKKEPMKIVEWIGLLLAVTGFIYLLLPGSQSPPMGPAILMGLSGISWGIYSLLGKGNSNPTRTTALNFILASPIALVLLFFVPFELTSFGWLLAVLSGGITSGLGYVLWYYVLKDLVTSTAAIVQLSVPAIASFGGILFLNESLSSRLVVASLLILGGIAIKVRGGLRHSVTSQ